MARHRRKSNKAWVGWLRIGAATAGLGAALGGAQAIATAAPTDSGVVDHHVGVAAESNRGPVKATGSRWADRKATRSVTKPRTTLTRGADTVVDHLIRRGAPAKPMADDLSARVRKSVTDLRDTVRARPAANKMGLRTGRSLPDNPVTRLLDSLQVTVHDMRNHLAGQGATRTTPSGVSAAAAPTEGTPGPPHELDDLVARPNVTARLNDNGSVHVITGDFTDSTVNNGDDAARVVNSLAGLAGAPTGFAAADNITVQQVTTPNGMSQTFYRVGHSVNGVPVVGSEVILVTDAEGRVTGLFNNYDSRADAVDMSMKPSVDSETEAAALALAAYMGSANPQPYRWLAPALIASGVAQPELIIDTTDPNSEPRLVWKVVIDPPETPNLTGASAADAGSTYYIRATGNDAGTVMRVTPNAQPLAIGSSASTTADDVLGDSREINIARLSLLVFDLDSLNDIGRNITTYRTTYLLVWVGPPLMPGTPVFRGLSGWDTSAVSAHANMAEVYDYYSTNLGLTSFDGAGAPIVISTEYNPHSDLASYTSGYENAYWDSSAQQFAFGDAGDLEAALDVVAHEYTHAVVDHVVGHGNPGLNTGESGALNEAYADIMGVLIEGKHDEGRWLIGEDSSAGAIRNLANPSSINTAYGPYRAHYDERYTGTGDDGGEHINSTIFSHAAYLMMEDPATAGISDETWAELFYRSMYTLTPGATFSDGRDSVVFAAGQMDFTEAQIAAIEHAFDEVGIEAGGTAVSIGT